MPGSIRPVAWLALAIAAAVGCAPLPPEGGPRCDPDNGGLSLPAGFCALVVAERLGPARNLTVADNGDVFVAIMSERGGVIALRDTNGDGRVDLAGRFGRLGGHDVKLAGGFFYFASDRSILRWPWNPGELTPSEEAVTLVRLQPQREHARKAIALGREGELFVAIGAPSNSCQEKNRQIRSPGIDPCPQLVGHAGVWRFDAGTPQQQPTPELRFASGMRHTLALAVNPDTGELWAAINGRDLLGGNWGYDAASNAALPAEEFARVRKGDDYGWPYCYYDGGARAKVLAPEYGGDGSEIGRCAEKTLPQLAFPAHWAPTALAFYTGTQFPSRYQGGAFVAFHGSWNRAPLPQEGYRLSFVPFRGGAPSGPPETFAIGAADPASIRFSGLAVGPDGSLFASADASEKIWRIQYRPRLDAP